MGFSIKCSLMTSNRISPTLGRLCSVISFCKNIFSRYPGVHCGQNRFGEKRWRQIQDRGCFWARQRGPKVRRQLANHHWQPLATPADQRLSTARSPGRKIHNHRPAEDAKLFPEPKKSHPSLTLTSQNFTATVWIIVIFIFAAAYNSVFLKNKDFQVKKNTPCKYPK